MHVKPVGFRSKIKVKEENPKTRGVQRKFLQAQDEYVIDNTILK